MIRRGKARVPSTVVTLIKAIANEFENTDRGDDDPVSVYVGLKRTESKHKIAELGGEPIYRTRKENIFSYRATDEFTRRDGGQSFFFKAHGMAELGEGTQIEDLQERVKRLREQMSDYVDVNRSSGVREGLIAGRGKYVKMGDLLYYVFDVSPKYELSKLLRKPALF
jgi:hypothetical protein